MTATARLLQGDGEIEVVYMSGPNNLLNNYKSASAPSSSETTKTANTSSKGDILAELGVKYGCDFDRDTVVGTLNEEPLPSGDPLEWFGALVSPNLRRTQKDFAAVLELLVELANAKRRILDGITRFEQKQ